MRHDSVIEDFSQRQERAKGKTTPQPVTEWDFKWELLRVRRVLWALVAIQLFALAWSIYSGG